MNLLFVCSKNQWRSLTSETMFKNHAFLKVKSAGTENSARIKISQKLIDWADLIFVMEKKHKARILEKFDLQTELIILYIEDDYKFMDPELIGLINRAISPYLID